MKPFQKALLAGLAAFTATASVSHAQETLGTINIVQLAAQKQTLPDTGPVDITSLGGQVTTRLKANVQRINSRTIIEALASTEGSGFPSGTPVAGWNIVEAFDADGGLLGLFAYKPGFAPVPLTEDFLSLVLPADTDAFETFVTVLDKDGSTVSKDNHYFTADITGTLLAADVAFKGVLQSTTSIRNIGPRSAPLTHTAVVRKGTIEGNTGTYSINGSLTSIGKGVLVSVQAFVDAAPAGE
jgi:hypothetical protein